MSSNKKVDILYLRYKNDNINANELLEGLFFVVAKNTISQKNMIHE
jgi:hypothetical protein